MPLHFRTYPIPLRIALATLVCAALPPALRAGDERRDEEALFFRTLESQGGRSHAAGERPELGPVLTRPVLTEPPPATFRVGLTPTAFNPDGTVLREYDTGPAHNHASVSLTATGPFELVELATGTAFFQGQAGEVVTFAKAGALMTVTGPGGALGSFAGAVRARTTTPLAFLVATSIRRLNRLLPLVAGNFQLAPPPYRGTLEVYPSEVDATKVRLVNILSFEEYVPGVVVNESIASFGIEALKAQAIAARGYAIANLGRFASRGFDIDDSTTSQVYRGQSSEQKVAIRASQQTAGLVMTRGGAIVTALYSSSMGGHTENNEYVFPTGGYPGTNVDPALRGIHDSTDPLTEDLTTESGVLAFYTTVYPGSSEVSPTTGNPLTSLHRWTRTRTAAELLARLKESFAVPASASVVSDVVTTLRGASGRMMRVVVSGDWGATTVQGWSDIRRLASVSGVTPGGTGATSAPNSPSVYTLTRDGLGNVVSVAFVGGGFGHNVGMSQYGAQGRALRGQTAQQILQGYYTGITIGPPPVAEP
jgi:peptidoglycan hydrolase-like amidase